MAHDCITKEPIEPIIFKQLEKKGVDMSAREIQAKIAAMKI